MDVKNRLLFEGRAKRCQVSSCLVHFFFFCVKQYIQVLTFGSFCQEKEQVIQAPQYLLNSNYFISPSPTFTVKGLQKYSK